jgi:hypothetical protein
VDAKSGAVIEPRGQRRKDNKRPMEEGSRCYDT